MTATIVESWSDDVQEITHQEDHHFLEDDHKTEDNVHKVEDSSANQSLSSATINLAAEDVQIVMEQQKQQFNLLTTKLNILFVVNGALLTSLTISRLIFFPSAFSIGELIGFLVNFTLLINAFLPRQVAVSPNLEDVKFLERYLCLTPDEYQLKMMVNHIATYNTNKQRLEDTSQTLTYAAYVTWIIALIMLLHMVSSFFVNKP